MKQRRYRVSLVGFQADEPPGSPARRQVIHVWRVLSWRLYLALFCVLLGCSILVQHFIIGG